MPRNVSTALLVHCTTADGSRTTLSVGATDDRQHICVWIGDGEVAYLDVVAGSTAIAALRDAVRIVTSGGQH